MIDPQLLALAIKIAARLNATPAHDEPARATFPGGVIYLGQPELAIQIHSVGTLFVHITADRTVVDAVAIAGRPGESRKVVRARHRTLREWGRRAFGDDIEEHDPEGHLGN